MMPTDASDTFVVGTSATVPGHTVCLRPQHVGFTTLLISLFRRGGPFDEVRRVDVQAFHVVGRPADLREWSGLRTVGPDR